MAFKCLGASRRHFARCLLPAGLKAFCCKWRDPLWSLVACLCYSFFVVSIGWMLASPLMPAAPLPLPPAPAFAAVETMIRLAVAIATVLLLAAACVVGTKTGRVANGVGDAPSERRKCRCRACREPARFVLPPSAPNPITTYFFVFQANR